MNKFRLTFTSVAIVVFTLMIASSAHAQNTRSWVSGVGDDVNPCSRTAPCKTFNGAMSRTAAGGEISVLDPGGFGTVTITKSVTINGEGALSGITNSLTNGVIINAGINDSVNLKYLTIQGVGNGLSGIRYLSAKNVNIEHVTIIGNTAQGIDMNKTAAGNLTVVNSHIRNCGGAGIRIETSAGLARATIRNTTIINCGTGINARKNSRVAVVESTIASNVLGVHVEGNGGTAVATLTQTQIANNSSHGVQAGGGLSTNPSVARLGDNALNNNGANGVFIDFNGGVETYLTNKIVGNTTDGCAGCISIVNTLN